MQALSSAGITPDSSKTYKRSEIESALAKLHGGSTPYLGCKDGALSEVWYFFNVKGNLIDGQFKPSESRKLYFVFVMHLHKS